MTGKRNLPKKQANPKKAGRAQKPASKARDARRGPKIASTVRSARKPGAKAGAAPAAAKRPGTKQAKLIDMLKRADGATIAEIVTATGWQSHTVRGAISGALKKRLGLNIVSEKSDTRGRVYRIAG
jgi:hypothetical protein